MMVAWSVVNPCTALWSASQSASGLKAGSGTIVEFGPGAHCGPPSAPAAPSSDWS